jgi:L-fucose isomerase-like protein
MNMSNSMNVLYVPVGVGTFDLVCAQDQFEKSISLLKTLYPEVTVPNEPLLTLAKLNSFLDANTPDFVIVQNITFANSAYVSEVLARFTCPLLLWTLTEPIVDGARLRLNSLTGAYSAANTMMLLGRNNFLYVLGSPEDESVIKKIKYALAAVGLKSALKGMKMAAIGHTPQGFGFGRALDSELLKNFSVRLESIEVRELMDKARSYKEGESDQYKTLMEQSTCNCETCPKERMEDSAHLMHAYMDYVKENNISALASRCWPDFFTSYGTPVCSVLSLLNDQGVASVCESDMYGALSQYVARNLTDKSSFFGDPVYLDDEAGTITYWHCGMAAPSLAQNHCACVGVHPNRKIGPVMDFACAAEKEVTIFRIGRKMDGSFRLFSAKGSALDVPKQFSGTSVVVKPNHDARSVVEKSVVAGWEPHFVVAYGDIHETLEMFAKIMDIEFCAY